MSSSRKVTIKALKQAGKDYEFERRERKDGKVVTIKEKGVNSSDGALKRIKATGMDMETGLRIYRAGAKTATEENRKTVLERDVRGMCELWSDMHRRDTSDSK